MRIISKQSLELLRQRVNLVEVLSPHIDLKRAGAAYKGLCPFHDEKTPSFTLQKGDSHYHCFGCGAHGDAVQFLMNHQRMSFFEAVESLAQRFHVPLEFIEGGSEEKSVNKPLLRQAMEHAARFYHFCLLHTPEGHQATEYLSQRGIDFSFIQQFGIGWAPTSNGLLRNFLHTKGIKDLQMQELGLLRERGGDFFTERILFPIHDPIGHVIGFSGRKYREEVFGGKYVNTPETSLFKKSKVLFGLNYSRREIAKKRKAIIVEGQIDALRLIYEGFLTTVAGQGTAFGESHVKMLVDLGVSEVYLAMDGDKAGEEATVKIGNLFQKEGVGVRVVAIPAGSDPDALLRQKGGVYFSNLLEESEEYLSFLVRTQGRSVNLNTPAGKTDLAQLLVRQIREWNPPLMVHESLRKLAHLLQIPEHFIGVDQEFVPNLYIRKSGSIGLQTVDPDRILETDFLRGLLLKGDLEERLLLLAKGYVKEEDLKVPICRSLYQRYLKEREIGKSIDLLAWAIECGTEGQLIMEELTQKKVNWEKAEEIFLETIQKVLNRNWMEARESLRIKIQSGQASEEEMDQLLRQFDALKKSPPKVL